MARRKNTRMFSREQRRANAADAARRDPAEAQASTDGIALHGAKISPFDTLLLSEAWRGLHDEPDRTEYESYLMSVLERQYRRQTGVALTIDVAIAEHERDEDQREAAREHQWLNSTGPEPAQARP
jgi:hypothetical protein